MEYTVRSGPAIDVFCFDADNYKKWEGRTKTLPVSGDEVRHFTELSRFGLKYGQCAATLRPGIYRIVIDNTDYGPTAPPANFQDDIATLHVKVVQQ
jgi:hypothetical protein